MTDKNNNTDDMDANISPEERSLLDESIENSMTQDNLELKHSSLDSTDEDGELLNENSTAFDVSGKDLDIPGAEDDDANEEIGEEDEENNIYSLPDQ